MTVQKDVTKNIYVGNGSTRTFPFTFECPAEHPEYIKVYLMQDDGTALATSDYQLDMDARQITYPSSGTALPEGKKLVIMRELPLQQMMNLVNNGPYFAEDVETAFDENVMAMQQIAEKLNRSIIMSVDIDGDAFVNEVPFEAGKSFRIADDGKSIVLTEDPGKVIDKAKGLLNETTIKAEETATNAQEAKQAAAEIKTIYNSGGLTPITDLFGSIGTAVKRWGYIFANKVFAMNLPIVYKSVAEMKADILLSAGMTACTLGYYAINDGGAGTYIIRAKQESDVDDGGSLHELANGNVAELVVENCTVNVKQFGVKGDGVTDDTEKMQKALDTRLRLNVNNGCYKITSQLNFYNSIICEEDAIIEFYSKADGNVCFRGGGNKISILNNKPCVVNGNEIIFEEDISDLLKAEDVLYIYNNEKVSSYARDYDTKREIHSIIEVNKNTIKLDAIIRWGYTSINVDKCNLMANKEFKGIKIINKNKLNTSYGFFLEWGKSCKVYDCVITGFDYSGIEVENSICCDVFNNYCKTAYSEELQYGIVIHSSFWINVYGNSCKNARTAIDITRCSLYIAVYGNSCVGAISTHSTSNVTITNNVINEGGIAIRGTYISAVGNSVYSNAKQCLYIDEMGKDGKITVSNNIFKGFCFATVPQAAVKILNNTFIVSKVFYYASSEHECVLDILASVDGSQPRAGLDISYNTFEYIGSNVPKKCIDCSRDLLTISDIRIQNNNIFNFRIGVDMSQVSKNFGNNLYIGNNIFKVIERAVSFRIVNNVRIINNTIIGIGDSLLDYAIVKTTDAVNNPNVLIIKDNYAKRCTALIKFESGDYTDKIITDNIISAK